MANFDNQTISKSLSGISTAAVAASVIVTVVLMMGFGFLFFIKDRQQSASGILLFFEKSSRNMGEVSGIIQSYLLSPEENGIWDEKELYETSAISFLNLAAEASWSKDMSEMVAGLTDTINDQLLPLENEFEKLIKQDPIKAKDFYLNKYVPELRKFDAKINLARSKANDTNDIYLKRITQTLYSIVFLTLALLIGNGLIVIRKSKSISGSVTELLENVCSSLVSNARTVQSASHQVENSSTTLAQAAGEQAASQLETSASIEEILRILTRNSQHAAANLEICKKGQQETVHGKEVVTALKAATEDIQSLNSRLETLIKIINDIDAKTNIINEIAFQTKILSFNASVEAARSGEHGKGFAVVAEEVGKLSAMSKAAAEEIKELISTSSSAVTEVVRLSQEKIGNANEISGQVTSLFDSFHRVMAQIMAATEQMMTAAMEQQTGMAQIKTTMQEVSSATEVTSDNSEMLANYARGLASESEAMRISVNRLSLLVSDNQVEQVPSSGETDMPEAAQAV
jgi:hypothetical protein